MVVSPVFVHGTLCHLPLLETVLGHPLKVGDVCPARLSGYAAFWGAGGAFAVLCKKPGAWAEGLLLDGLSAADIARLDFYEGAFGHERIAVSVHAANGPVPAEVYRAASRDHPVAGEAWDLALWGARRGRAMLYFAAEIMSEFGQRSAHEVAARAGPMAMRAAARLRAETPRPTALRLHAGPGDVVVSARQRPYAKFFALEDYRLRHRRFSGEMSAEVERAVFVCADAVTVLPYDPVRDRVLLVEQFRIGPFARGDTQPWSLEPIAGRIDPGETPEETARREAMEEAGLALGEILPIGQYYPSPGAVDEYIYSYLALADLPDEAARLGGLAAEHEDIRGHVIGFGELMRLVESGEAENGPLLLSALVLARRRKRLMSGA